MHFLLGIGLLFLIVAGVFGYESAQSIFRWLIGSYFPHMSARISA